jgi:CRISPR/Cas system-associated protein Cas10 (large subunit of type III CRISPR-Cas system)
VREWSRRYWRESVQPNEEKRRRRKESGRQHYYRRQYGITREQWEQQLEVQGGVCAICQNPDRTGRFGILNVDHCHTTGRVRGLLCAACNVAIAALGDNVEGVERALSYMRGELDISPRFACEEVSAA